MSLGRFAICSIPSRNDRRPVDYIGHLLEFIHVINKYRNIESSYVRKNQVSYDVYKHPNNLRSVFSSYRSFRPSDFGFGCYSLNIIVDH